MKSFPTPSAWIMAAFVTAVMLTLPMSAIAAVISSMSGYDAQVDSTGVVNVTPGTSANPSHVGYSGSTGRATVLVFALPDLPVDTMFATASFQLRYFGRDGTPGFSGDLYGLGFRTSPEVLASDYFSGVSDPNAMLIQDNFLPTSLPLTGSTRTTSEDGDAGLTAYLNAQLAASAAERAEGETVYVFLRINPDATLSNNFTRYKISTAVGTGFNETPQITYETVLIPEPASLALLGLGGATILVGRRRSVHS